MSHCIIPELLDPASAASLLAYALENESRFESTTVGAANVVRSETRTSRNLDLGSWNSLIEERVAPLVPELTRKLGITPFKLGGFETELVAHEHGAFYKRHIDLFTGSARRSEDRMISLVCYLHSEPRQFTGGELRLFPLPHPSMTDQTAIDITPQHRMAVAFSSWLPHEVLPLACPSRQFKDARFAVNCWVLREPTSAQT